jgi:ABC-2 type transport system permease protein
MPLVQLFILGYAVNTDVKNIYTAVYDFDRSELSRDYIRSLTAGDYLVQKESRFPVLNADQGFRENDYNVAMIIPKDFSRDWQTTGAARVGLLVDGTNANSATIAMGYTNIITAQFSQKTAGLTAPISLQQKRLYNPEGESVYYMIPGIISVILTMITVMLTSMAIVREREIGTLEQLMVTPITTPVLLLGKMIPAALVGFAEMTLGLIIGLLWFKIPFLGSPFLFYGMAFLFLFTALGVGIFVSTFSRTQQQAMFYTWFFSIFAIMTSGFFTPIDNMPRVVQYLTYLNPLRYFMKVVRGIIMKGAVLSNLYPEAIAMVIFGTVIFTIAWLRFSKRME